MASDGDKEYREHTMEAIGGHMQAAVNIIKGEVSHTDHLAIHAGALAELSAIVPALFPAGSGEGTDAKPAIWENPDDFAERVEAFKTAAPAFDAAVSSGEGVGPAIQNLGQACKSCHDDYRAE
jgi:cytochrome c556